MKKLTSLLVLLTIILWHSPALAATDVKNDPGLSNGLVAYYELEEASGARTDSHGSNNLTDVNTVGSATGKIGNAADFEASSLERLTTTSPFTTATTDFSVAFWLKLESVGAYQSVMQNGRQANFWNILITSAGVIEFFEDNIAEYPSTATLSAGVWYHFAMVKTGNGAGNIQFYVNGSTAGTASAGSISTPTTSAYLGAYSVTGSTYNFYLDGVLDELLITTRALSGSEVAELYNSGAGIPYDAGGGPPPDRRIIHIH